MSYKVVSIPQFDKDVKRLAKKYQSIKRDLATLAESLAENPTLGQEVFRNCYKIRLAISSKGKGKRGGARVLTYVLVKDATLFLLSIYDKSDLESITDKEILELINSIDF